MTVKKIMKRDVATCSPDSDLTAAVKTMRDRNCGFLPVIDSHGGIVGVVTDRDACIAVANYKDRPPLHIAVKEVMRFPVFSCFPDENIKVALATMAKHHVRRLPVLDRSGHLQGVLSIDDIIQTPRRRGTPTTENIVNAYKRICARPILGAAYRRRVSSVVRSGMVRRPNRARSKRPVDYAAEFTRRSPGL